MNLLFLYGPPGVGKLTVARELAARTNYKLFHNHLTVDLVYAVFDFKTRPFIELRDKTWMMVFQKAKEEKVPGLIFTFAPEESVPTDFIPNLITQIEDANNHIYFIELTCSPEELKKRIVSPSRSRYSKGMKPDNIEKYYARQHLIPEEVHQRKYVIDNTNMNPSSVADEIINHFQIDRAGLATAL
jgi:shikimate kinase